MRVFNPINGRSRSKKSARVHGWRKSLRLESLEDRRMLAFDPSGMEQEMLEHINRMRINPQDELDVLFLSTDVGHPNYFTSSDTDVNIALNFFGTDAATLFSQWSALEDVPPLAWNEFLADAALGHNNEMIAQNMQSHQLPGEDSLLTRIENAGYNWTGSVSVGENVFAYTESVFHGHSAFAIDWGSTPTGIQDPPGHRDNIMDPTWLEVGISISQNNPVNIGDVGPLLVTQDFAYRSNYGDPKALGVVYTDADGNGRYDAGEGEAGVTITLTNGNQVYSTTTMTAGGYQIAVPAGTYAVTASGGSLAGSPSMGTVIVRNDNVKLDLETGTIPTSAVLAGIVFDDADEDGVLDVGEAGLPGWTVFIDANSNGTLDGNEVSKTTNANGQYAFSLEANGTYTLAFVDQGGGVRLSSGGSPTQTATVVVGDTVTDLHFALFKVYETVGSSVRFYGTSAVDTFTWSRSGGNHNITFNGQAYAYNSTTYDEVYVDGRGGEDTINLTASTGDDSTTIHEGEMTLSGAGYSFAADNFERVNVDLNGGANDLAYLYDGPENDDMISHTTYGRLVGSSYNFYVEDFDKMYTFATAGGNDRAYVYDGPTDDRFVGRTDFSVMHGNNQEFYIYMEGFERNFAYSTAGGTDFAFFYDSVGNDNFFAQPTYSVMQDAAVSYFNYASGFDKVFAYANSTGMDSAYLTDSSGDDKFYGRATRGILQGAGNSYYNEVHDFEKVYSYATNGGNDIAYFYDSAGKDTFYAYPTYSYLRGPNSNFYNQAQGYEQVIAYSINGGDDTAYLHDSAGSDLYYGRNRMGFMAGTGFYNRVDDFEHVEIFGNNGGVNTLNIDALQYSFVTTGTWV